MSLVVGVVLAVVSVPVGVGFTALPWSASPWTHGADWYMYHAKVLVRRRSHAVTVDSWSWTIEPDGLHSGWSPPSDFDVASEVVIDPRPPHVTLWLDTRGGGVFSVRAGWPLRAAHGELKTSAAWLGGSRGKGEHMDAGIWYTQAFGQYVNVPYLPLWPGLLGNTLFYTLLVLTPLALLRWRKIRRRTKRGLCLACAYELGEGVGVCPECGLALKHP